MEKLEKKDRNSNIELLRIFAMILIMLHHYALHGGLFNIEGISINRSIGAIAYIGGKIGVNIFVLITGFFMIESKFKIKKLIKLVLQVLCYTIPIFIFSIIFNGIPTFDVIKKSLFPITFSAYWFITAYVGLYIFSPFINKLIKSIENNSLLVLIILLVLMCSGIGFISSESEYMSNLVWFVLMYMIGAYIRLYDMPKAKIKLFAILGYIVFIIGACVAVYLSQYNEIFIKLFRKVLNVNSIIVLIESILIFTMFKNINIKSNKMLNFFGKYSFGVYLFHDNFIFKEFLWKNICKVEIFYDINPMLLVLHIVGCTIGIYLVGSLIEYLRIKIIEENIFKITKFDKYFSKIDNYMNIQ